MKPAGSVTSQAVSSGTVNYQLTDLHLFDASGTRLPDTAATAAPTEENTATWAS